MANEKTPNYHWDIPNPYGLQIVEMMKVASTFGAIDSRFKAFEDAYISHKHSFADITDRPTTLNGYGITDAITTDQVRSEIETSQAAQQSVIDQSISNLASSTAAALDVRLRFDAQQPISLTNRARARANINALGIEDKGAPNGVATLDAGGKIPSSQLPPVAITDTFVVNSQASMLALAAERGDVAIRTDLKQTFILRLEPATVLANWQEIMTPADGVLTVNGLSGPVINLSAEDVGAATPAQVAAKLDRNNPNFTGRGIGTQLSLRDGDSGANRNLLGFGFTGDADDTQKWILRSDGVLVLCKMNPATGGWERDLLQVHPNGDVRASATIGVGQSFMGGDGNVGGSVWSLTGSSDLFNYINKMTWGKTSVELGFAVYANEDWGWRETVAPWTKCLAFCVSKTTQTQDDRRRPRKLEGQHDWGWETWASMAGADEWGAEIAGSNTTGDRTMFSLAYTTMGRFRVSGGWGRTNERMAFLRIA